MDITYTPPPTIKRFMRSNAQQRFCMGSVGCVAGDTLILTEHGPQRIDDLVDPVHVLSWCKELGRFILSPSSGGFVKGEDRLYRVSTRWGSFDAAGHHRVLCEDQTYRFVTELREGDVLAQHNGDVMAVAPIIAVERLREPQMYWDMQVLDTNNYVTVDGSVHHNSGKTTGMIFELVRRAVQTPPGPDGIRRSRWLVTRLTMPQLKDTVLKSWLTWFPDGKFGKWRSNDSTYWLEFNDVQAEVLFRPLESEADVARVLSLELTGAWIAECRDLPVSMISDIKGRCGRFPEPKMDYWYGVFGETNPPAEGSDWYKLFEGLPQEEGNPDSVVDAEVFIQPCPVNDDFTLRPEAENVENLKPTYYQDLAKGATSDYIRVFIKGEYGRNRKGQPVYLESFQRQLHVSPKPIPIDAQQPILVGMDFGLTPAAIIAQPDPHRARLNILREVVTPKGTTNGVEQFIIKRLRPFLRSYFPSNPIVIIGDPANTRAETDERTSFKVLKEYGFIAKKASTNDPLVRINAVESLLAMFPHGEAMIQVDPSCKVLIEGFLFGYMFAASKGGDIADKPFKNCIWSHPHDALQYLCLYYNRGYDPQEWLPTSVNPLHQHRGYRPADAYAGY